GPGGSARGHADRALPPATRSARGCSPQSSASPMAAWKDPRGRIRSRGGHAAAIVLAGTDGTVRQIRIDVIGGHRVAQTVVGMDPRELIRLLERQRDVFQHLRSLADRQRALVEQDDPQPLLVLLSERQRLVEDLNRCNSLLAPYRRNWA